MQQTLFREGPKRDLEAANRALARVRAELGDGAVLRMVRRDGHLPEAMYGFEPMTRLEPARPRLDAQPRWIRRVLKKPRRLPGAPRVSRDEGWRPIDPAAGPVVKMHGPYVVSGGWWQREQQREYHFAQTLRGDLLWVYFDRVQRCWYLHGWVA
jgi:protein ImuB